MTTNVAETPIYDELQNSLYEDRGVDVEEILHRPKWDYEQACARVEAAVLAALKGRVLRDSKGRFKPSQ